MLLIKLNHKLLEAYKPLWTLHDNLNDRHTQMNLQHLVLLRIQFPTIKQNYCWFETCIQHYIGVISLPKWLTFDQRWNNLKLCRSSCSTHVYILSGGSIILWFKFCYASQRAYAEVHARHMSVFYQGGQYIIMFHILPDLSVIRLSWALRKLV